MKTLLALDPGKTNFGYSVLCWLDDHRYKVVKCGMLTNTVRDLKGDVFGRIKAYDEEIGAIVSQYKVGSIVAERFVSRGLLGSLSEYVNLMLGLTSKFATDDFCLIIPATWKNRFNKKYCLKSFYKEASCTKHVVDATLIGIYYIDTIGKKEHYLDFCHKNRRNRILHLMKKTSSVN